MRKLSADSVALVQSSGYLSGEATARHRVVMFSDVECTYCRQMYASIQGVRDSVPGGLVLVHRHFPLANGGRSYEWALAIECAAAAGRGEQMLQKLYVEVGDFRSVSIDSITLAAMTDRIGEFRTCYDARLGHGAIERDVALAHALGITGTPLLLVGNTLVGGAITSDSLRAMLKYQVASP